MKNMQKNIMMSLAVSVFLSCTQADKPQPESVGQHETKTVKQVTDSLTGWTNIGNSDSSIIISMPYADTGNFTHQKIYDCAECLLREEVARALLKASETAKTKGFRLVMFDCYRPASYHQKLFDIVKDTRYVASPEKGSKHSGGCAADLSLADRQGNALDMGSAFDDFTEASHYHSKRISAAAAQNRKMLRTLMSEAGFEPYNNEWWHFNYKGCKHPKSDYHWKCR